MRPRDRRGIRRWRLRLGGLALALVACGGGPEDKLQDLEEWAGRGSAGDAARIRALAGDPHRDVRIAVIRGLVAVGDPAAAEVARAALADPEPRVRAAALVALGDLRAQGVEDLIAERLAAGEPIEVRRAAARSLRRSGSPRAGELLATGLEDADREVRLESIAGLDEIGLGGALETLTGMAVQDLDWEVRAEAVRVLARTDRPEVVAAVEAARADPNEMVRAAAWAARRRMTVDAPRVEAAP